MSIKAKPWEGGGAASVPDASETVKGIIRIATSAEATTGTDDTIAMTPLTVKERIDASLVGGVEYKGTFNATAGTPSLANAEKGDLYIIDTAGTIYGQDWNVGDHLLINENMGGSITNSKIDKIDNTVSDASETVKGIIEIATNTEAGAGLATDKALVPSNVSSLSITSSQVSGLATVATTGAYSDLSGTPTLATVATTGAYSDLSGTPTLGTAASSDTSDFLASTAGLDDLSDVSYTADPSINDYVLTYDHSTTSWGAEAIPSASAASETVAGVIEIATNAEAGAGSATDKALVPSNVSSLSITSGQVSGLATVATTGAYSDLSGTPTLATVATTGAYSDLSGTPTLGTAAALDVGTAASNVVQLDGSARLPAVDGSQLTNLPSASAASETVAGVIEIATNAEAGAGSATDKALVPSNVSSLSITSGQVSGLATVATTGAYSDLSGTPTLGTAAALDVGTAASNVVQLDGSARLPAVDGSQLTNLPSASDASETVKGIIEIATNTEAGAGSATDKALVPSNVSSLSIGSGQVSGLATVATSGAYSDLSGTPTLGTAAALDVGTGASNVVQLDGSSRLPAVDGSQLTNLPSGATDLNGLSDVTITSAASGNLLQHNGSGQFVNVAKSTIDVGSFNDDGTYLNDVVDDTTPQLGGPLDTNGQSITSASNADVTIDPNGTGDIVVGADVLPAADATHTLGAEDNRFITLHSELNGAVQFKARNESGAALTKGQAVYISGVSGTVPLISLARANSASTMPAFGLLAADVSNNADVQVITFGNLTDYNTTTYSLSANDTVFVSAATAGALTNTAPTGESNLIQNIGRVVRADASAGIIKVGGAGRSNATPNLDDGKIFLGNASNQAVSTALSAIDVSAFNDDGTYLKDVIEDTTPQLGGDLDVNANEIVSASNNNVILRPNGTGVVQLGGNTNPAEIRLYCESGDAHYVGLKSPAHASLSGSQTWTLPTADGTTGQVIQTNGSGVLSFVDQSGGGGWTYSAITADPANAQAGYHYSCTGTFTITLPTSGVSSGEEIRVKNMGTGTITIDPQTSNIDGATTDYVMDIQYSAITLVSTGTHWEII